MEQRVTSPVTSEVTTTTTKTQSGETHNSNKKRSRRSISSDNFGGPSCSWNNSSRPRSLKRSIGSWLRHKSKYLSQTNLNTFNRRGTDLEQGCSKVTHSSPEEKEDEIKNNETSRNFKLWKNRFHFKKRNNNNDNNNKNNGKTFPWKWIEYGRELPPIPPIPNFDNRDIDSYSDEDLDDLRRMNLHHEVTPNLAFMPDDYLVDLDDPDDPDELHRRMLERSMEASDNFMDFSSSIEIVKNYGWYWGPLSGEAAEKLLSEEPDGSFLVRDSSADHYIFSLTFKLNGSVRHVRIEHDQGNFSFGPFTKFKSKTIVHFIENAVEHSRSGRYLFFLHRRPVIGPMRVQLLHPLSRFKCVQSLQHLCRFVILRRVTRDRLQQLPVPPKIQEYLNTPFYYSEKVADDNFENETQEEKATTTTTTTTTDES